MSKFNKERLNPEIFQIDEKRMREGWYSDKYFDNNRFILEALAKEGYTYKGNPDMQFEGVDLSTFEVGNGIVEMQVFTRRKPFSVIAGVDEALAILEKCTGYYDEDGKFINTYNQLEIEAVEDGTFAYYDGESKNVQPVLKIRGRYRDFAVLETNYLGVLAEATRVATNVYNVLVAAMEKKVLFFPARFAHWKLQGVHGYAYSIAVDAFKEKYGREAGKFVSTLGQGEWWGGEGGGTLPHALIAMFFGDLSEAMYQYCRLMPVEVPRIALVDYHNDCIRDTENLMKRLFDEYWKLYKEGKKEEARKFRLDGVRPDTSGTMVDKSIRPRTKEDFGVSPALIWNLRDAIDNFADTKEVREDLSFDQTEALKEWLKGITITVTGGFNNEKIDLFKKMGVPCDTFGVGSSLLENCVSSGTNNDFTADIVKIKVGDTWYNNSKVGRVACDNPNLKRIQ